MKGHCCVRRSSSGLGAWIPNQRNCMRRYESGDVNAIPEYRYKMLRSLGLESSPGKLLFHEAYEHHLSSALNSFPHLFLS